MLNAIEPFDSDVKAPSQKNALYTNRAHTGTETTINTQNLTTTATTATGIEVDSSGANARGKSLFQRLNSFIHFYFLSNKCLFVFSILTYIFDLLLFISLSLYLFTDKSILVPVAVVSDLRTSSTTGGSFVISTTNSSTTTTTTTSTSIILTSPILANTTTALSNSTSFLNTTISSVVKQRRALAAVTKATEVKYELKQSYLSLQIIAIFVFFVCFILNNLIKLQFKYHRLALRKNRYRYRYNRTPDYNDDDDNYEDDEEDEECGENQSVKHNYSFTTSSSSYYSSSMSSHRKLNKIKKVLKLVLGKFSRYLLYMYYGYQYCQNTFLTEIFNVKLNETILSYNESNNDSINNESILRINVLLTVIILIATVLRVIIYYLKIYLTDSKQQQQQTTNYYCFLFLFVGFNLSLFHLFTFKVVLQLIFTSFLVLLTKILFDFKQFKSAFFQILLYSFCLNHYFRIYLNSNFNLIIYLCFMLTFYYRIQTQQTSTCLEILNKRFLCRNLKLHKLCILVTLGLKLVLLVVIISILITKYKSYYFSLIILLPLVSLLSVIWLMFNFLHVINLWLVMNKISECYKIAFENAGLSNVQMSREQAIDDDDDDDASDNDTTFHDLPAATAATATEVKTSGLRKMCNRFFKSKMPVKLKVLIRIMAYKNIRHLATISYYIGVICFIQTLLLIIFVINISSLLILNLFLIIICVNLFWLNLINELSSLISGTSIIYALVSPIDDLISTNGMLTLAPSSSSVNNNANNSLPTYQNTYYQPSFHKQENLSSINKRSTYILNKLYKFINNYLIENFGCDYLNPSYNRLVLESRLRAFFSKVTLDGPRYNTYILYYCGLTIKTLNNQQQVCNMVLSDGTQFTIEDIINIWKDIHCKQQPQQPSRQHNKKSKNSIKYKNIQNKADTTDSDDQLYSTNVSTHPNGAETVVTFENSSTGGSNTTSSRLILVFDAENTDLLVKYVADSLTQKNLFVALQTACYLNKPESKRVKKQQHKDGEAENGDASKRSRQQSNVGRFTIDWINYNCKSTSLTNEHIIDRPLKDADHHNHNLDDDSDYESLFNSLEQQQRVLNEENDDSDEMFKNMNANANEMQTFKVRRRKKNDTASNLKANKYYECKYALSKYWTTYNFESNDLQEDMKQFWKTNYPRMLQPMLKLINLSLFSLKFNCFKEMSNFFTWMKHKILPLPKEYDTSHGFKLIST